MLNGENHRTEWSYDKVNRVTHSRRFMGTTAAQVVENSYDADGNRLGMIDAAQQTFSYEIDALRRETKAIYPFNENSPDQTLERIERTYDDLDRELEVTQIRKQGAGQTSETRSLEWDFAGRQTTETDAHGVSQTYTYDDNGNRLSADITIPQQASRAISYTYDHRNRLKTVTEGGTTTYNYHCRGEKLDTIQRADGSLETYLYDNADRLTSKTITDGSSNLLLSYDYQYDKADRRLSQTENHGQGGETTTYTYDGNSALHTVDYPDSKHVEYVYDQAGNRKQETITAGTEVVSDKTFEYNDLEELTGMTDAATGDSTGYSYDANGNQIGKMETTAGSTKVTDLDYTTRNHVSQVKVDGTPVALFQYDDAGRRIQKNTELEHWDGAALIAETDAASGVVLRDYTYGLAVIRETVIGQSVQVYTDILGSIGLLDGSTADAHYRYDAFGAMRESADCTANPNQLSCRNSLTYTGHLFDSESSLYYFNARYYDSSTGLFTSTDPAADLSKYRDYFDAGIVGTTFAGTQMMPSMVIGQHAADYSVVQTENGLEPAFASLQIGANPLAKSDPFLSAANSADWSLSAAKDAAAPQLTFDQRPQYVSSESTGYPPIDASVPYSWYPYAYALNSPLNYTDPLGLESLPSYERKQIQENTECRDPRGCDDPGGRYVGRTVVGLSATAVGVAYPPAGIAMLLGWLGWAGTEAHYRANDPMPMTLPPPERGPSASTYQEFGLILSNGPVPINQTVELYRGKETGSERQLGDLEQYENAQDVGFFIALTATSTTLVERPGPGVRELEVGRAGDLTRRGLVGDGLANDHIPSLGALKIREEMKLGRPLTPAESRALRNRTFCIVCRDSIHAQSRTFKGRNTLAVRQQDAQNLFGATRQDSGVFYRNAVQQGLDPLEVWVSVMKLHLKNWWSGNYR